MCHGLWTLSHCRILVAWPDRPYATSCLLCWRMQGRNDNAMTPGTSRLAAGLLRDALLLSCAQAVGEAGSKQEAAKAQSQLLPAVAKAANDPVPDIREAALCVLVAFSLKAGASLPPKVLAPVPSTPVPVLLHALACVEGSFCCSSRLWGALMWSRTALGCFRGCCLAAVMALLSIAAVIALRSIAAVIALLSLTAAALLLPLRFSIAQLALWAVHDKNEQQPGVN